MNGQKIVAGPVASGSADAYDCYHMRKPLNNPNAATARLSVMLAPAMKRRLETEARAQKTTVGDLVRQRLGESPEDLAFAQSLTAMAGRAQAVMAELAAIRAGLARDEADAAAREVELRRATLAALSPAAADGLADLLRGAVDALEVAR